MLTERAFRARANSIYRPLRSASCSEVLAVFRRRPASIKPIICSGSVHMIYNSLHGVSRHAGESQPFTPLASYPKLYRQHGARQLRTGPEFGRAATAQQDFGPVARRHLLLSPRLIWNSARGCRACSRWDGQAPLPLSTARGGVICNFRLKA